MDLLLPRRRYFHPWDQRRFLGRRASVVVLSPVGHQIRFRPVERSVKPN
jgi:hypothetical protein